MKKVLLIGINARYSHVNLALYCLRTYVSDLNYRVKIKEFSINRGADKILNEIIDEDPEAAAFSVYIWNAELIKSIFAKIKKYNSSIKIILGGPEVSYNSDRWIDLYPQIDFIIKSRGEQGFHHLLSKKFKLKNRIIDIENTVFNEIPIPYLETDFKVLKNRYIYYESSRGCPFKCAYCISSCSDQYLELKDCKKVKDELSFILGHEIDMIKFIDRTFNINKTHYIEIWKYLVSDYSRAGVKFHFEIYPALLDEADFDILSKCPDDLFQFEIGIQSVNPKTLKAVNRNDLWDRIKPKISRLIGFKKFHIHVDLISGLPYEDLKSLKYSFNEVYRLSADHFQLGILKILPGTQISIDAEKYGIKYSEHAPYQIIENRWLTLEEIKRIENIAVLVNRIYNSHGYEKTLKILEEMFSSPFDLFNRLSEFMEINKIRIIDRKWESVADFILKFSESEYPEKKLYLLDCLRLDWCVKSKSHHLQFPIVDQSGKMLK